MTSLWKFLWRHFTVFWFRHCNTFLVWYGDFVTGNSSVGFKFSLCGISSKWPAPTSLHSKIRTICCTFMLTYRKNAKLSLSTIIFPSGEFHISLKVSFSFTHTILCYPSPPSLLPPNGHVGFTHGNSSGMLCWKNMIRILHFCCKTKSHAINQLYSSC